MARPTKNRKTICEGCGFKAIFESDSKEPIKIAFPINAKDCGLEEVVMNKTYIGCTHSKNWGIDVLALIGCDGRGDYRG